MLCGVLGFFAAALFVSYVGLGIWIITPLPWSAWGPESREQVSSRLARVGVLRWFALALCGAGLAIAGSIWGC
jgi:hypothetical protein